jgi:hypothetical protein
MVTRLIQSKRPVLLSRAVSICVVPSTVTTLRSDFCRSVILFQNFKETQQLVLTACVSTGVD